MDKLTAAIVTPGSFPIPSANSSSVERVIEQMIPFMRDRLNLVVFGKASPGYAASEVVEGTVFERYPSRPTIAYLNYISRRLHDIAPDVIEVENRPRYVRFLRNRHPNSRIWLSLQSTTFISKPHIGYRELQMCLRAADRIIVNSEFLRGHVAAMFPGAASKLHVNHLGVNTEQFVSRWTPEGEALRHAFAESLGPRMTGRKVILYVGRLLRIKGVHHLLRVMPRIIAQHPDAMLVIVGSALYGTHRKTRYVRLLHRLAASMPRHVKFVPFVPYDSIHHWFRYADVAVVPSFAREAFGLVNVEAMASGVPVIASRAGGMPEIVVDGVTGYLVEGNRLRRQLTNRLLTLLADPALRQRMGMESIGRVQSHFTWRHTAERWLQWVYEAAGRIQSENDDNVIVN